jgi:hypothetical protein
MELLVDLQRRVFTTVNPSKIIELFKLGEGTPLTLGIRTPDVVDGFYSFLGFPRLVNSAAVKKAISRGIQEGFFGYYSGSIPVLGNDGKYQVPLARVRFNTMVGEDEIDMDSGFLMMPQAVPVAAASPASAATWPTGMAPGASGTDPILTLSPPPGVPSGASPSEASAAQKSVEINFSADRNQLFSAWNAIANLADLAGKVNVTVRADSAEGFDKNKLQNGVLEPLRESDLIK